MGLKLKSTGGTGSVELNCPDNHNINTSFTLPTSNFTGGEWVLADGSGNVNIDSGTLYVDAVNNRVGVGTNSPSVELSIAGSDPQLVLWEGADGASSSKVQLGTGTVQGFINIHKGDGTRTVQLNSDGDSYFTGGNVGIGTTNPTRLLTVQSTGNANFCIKSSTTGTSQCMFGDTDSDVAGNIAYSHSNNSMAFEVNGSTAATIDSSGHLLVGGTTAGNAGTVTASIGNPGATNGGLQLWATTTGSSYVQFGDSSASASDHYRGAIGYQHDTDQMIVYTAGSERMRIQSNGDVLMAATNPNDNSDTGFKFRTSNSSIACTIDTSNGNESHYHLYNLNATNNGYRFYVKANGGVVNHSGNNVNLSDINVKKDISPAAGTWDCIKEWEIVNYRYKNQPDDADLNLGVIAQQVAESCPEVITVFEEAKQAKAAVLDDDGNEVEPAQEAQPEKLGVKEQQMMWMAIKALQEAQTRIETLEAINASFEARLTALEGGQP